MSWGRKARFELDGKLGLKNVPTATDSGMELRLAVFPTLTEALDYAAQGQTGFNYYNGRGDLTSVLPYSELRDKARALARKLQGLGRGARVALVAHTHPDFMVVFYACQYAGLVPVPLPAAIHLGGHEAYVRHLRQMIADCKAAAAFAPDDFIALLREAVDGLDVAVDGEAEQIVALCRQHGARAKAAQDNEAWSHLMGLLAVIQERVGTLSKDRAQVMAGLQAGALLEELEQEMQNLRSISEEIAMLQWRLRRSLHERESNISVLRTRVSSGD